MSTEVAIQKEPYAKENLLADLVDFWRQEEGIEVLQEVTDIKARVLHVIAGAGDLKDRALVNKVLGEVNKIETKSPVRKRLLKFLAEIARTQTEEKKGKPPASLILTAGEKITKGEAKGHYDRGNYQAALDIALTLLQSRSAGNNPGVLGFIMNCYHRLKNYKKTLEYAEILINLEGEETKLPRFFIAATAANELGDYPKALSYYEIAYHMDPSSPTLLNMAYETALRSGNHRKILKFSNALLEIKPGSLDLLVTKMTSSDALGYKGLATKTAKEILHSHPKNATALAILKKYKKK